MVKKSHQGKSKPRKTLTIIGAVILVLTYTAKDLLKEKTKDLSDSVQSAEALYRTELGQSNLSMQDMAFRRINQINQINQIIAQPEIERDYSDVIRSDLVTGQQVLGDLNASFDDVSRFLDALPSGAYDLRQARDQMRASIDKTNQQVTEMLKPSPKHDWVRAVQIKLAIVVAATSEIPVAMLGDAVMTRAHQVEKAADRAYRFTVWASYLFYLLGVGLALYANLSGIRSLGEPE